MIEVEILRGTALGGIGNDAYPGDRISLPDAQAQALIAAGRARLTAAAPAQDKPVAARTRKAKE
jgi:hypothetical protein